MKDTAMVIEELKSLEELIIQCSRCGTCQSVCPLYKNERREQAVARGKIFLVEALYEGRLEKAEEIFTHLDNCLLCGRCKRECPSGVETDEIFLRAKAVLRKIKKMPRWQALILKTAMRNPGLLATMTPVFRVGLNALTKKNKQGLLKPKAFLRSVAGKSGDRHLQTLAKEPFTKRYGGLNRANDEKMRVIFYPGCAITLIYADWGEAIVELLTRFGISVYVPETNLCCGIPSATMGERERYGDQVRGNLEWFDAVRDADTIITSCPTCQYGLSEMGESVTGIKSSKRFVDIVVFLEEILGDALPTGIPLRGITTLHIPCHYEQGKKSKLKDFILKHFATDYRDLDNQGCCGFGGTFNLKNYRTSRQIGLEKAEEVLNRNIQTLFAPCPGCAMQLSDACAAVESEVIATHPVIEIYKHLQKRSPHDENL